MLVEDIVFRWKLSRLQKEEAKIWSVNGPDLDKAKDSEDWNEEQSIFALISHQVDMVQNEIRKLQHQYVTKQAERLLLPFPDFAMSSPEWVQSDYDNSWSLTPITLTRLWREVRQERRERLELMFLWPSALIGFVGGLAGIVTAFLK